MRGEKKQVIVLSKFRTSPYTSKELAMMSEEKRMSIKIQRLEKVEGEIVLSRFSSNDSSKVKKRLLNEIAKNYPSAIIGYTHDSFKHVFIFNEGCVRGRDGILESIIFQKNDTSNKALVNYSKIERSSSKRRPPRDMRKPNLAVGWSIKTTIHEIGTHMETPLVIKNDDAILCRIFGRSHIDVDKAQQYFLNKNGLTGKIGIVTNSIVLGGGYVGSVDFVPSSSDVT